ncbi:helix-turn-helix domain-containing protein [Pseudactinotalea terrae]|uniref:helix-turn-helix domain-containing protein n=1 Tax=Pseudactinotalea terrae TaxID=1743262 RepID=UPI0012E0F491|nr:hypothetical protein [Pseudactinotalea terrae]
MTDHLSMVRTDPQDAVDAAAAQAAADASTLMNRVVDGKDRDELARVAGLAGRRLVEVLGGDGDVRVSTLARVLRAAGYGLELRVVPTEATLAQELGPFFGAYLGKPCPQGPHRGPEGPNEDLATCPLCGGGSWTLRPEGETLGLHAQDCSLPVRHESRCIGGGTGHAPAPVVRGFWAGMDDEVAAARARHQDTAA